MKSKRDQEHTVDFKGALEKIDRAMLLLEKGKPIRYDLIDGLKAVRSNIETLDEDLAGAPPGYIQHTREALQKLML